MSDRRSAKKSKSKELTEQLSKDELLRRLKVCKYLGRSVQDFYYHLHLGDLF